VGREKEETPAHKYTCIGEQPLKTKGMQEARGAHLREEVKRPRGQQQVDPSHQRHPGPVPVLRTASLGTPEVQACLVESHERRGTGRVHGHARPYRPQGKA